MKLLLSVLFLSLSFSSNLAWKCNECIGINGRCSDENDNGESTTCFGTKEQCLYMTDGNMNYYRGCSDIIGVNDVSNDGCYEINGVSNQTNKTMTYECIYY